MLCSDLLPPIIWKQVFKYLPIDIQAILFAADPILFDEEKMQQCLQILPNIKFSSQQNKIDHIYEVQAYLGKRPSCHSCWTRFQPSITFNNEIMAPLCQTCVASEIWKTASEKPIKETNSCVSLYERQLKIDFQLFEFFGLKQNDPLIAPLILFNEKLAHVPKS